MNYLKHYDLLINRAKSRVKPSGYCERHHVVPRCMGGDNSVENLVWLTAAEHYVAHQLLVKMHPESRSLAHAALFMSTKGANHKRNNKMYSWLKSRASLAMTGAGNPMFGRECPTKGKKHSEETLKILSEKAKARKHTEATKKKIGEAQKGKKASKETIEKLCKAQQDMAKKRKELGIKRTASDEARRKMSIAHKGKRAGDKHPLFGKKRSAESRQKTKDTFKRKKLERQALEMQSIKKVQLSFVF
jgi:hypothetical protein